MRILALAIVGALLIPATDSGWARADRPPQPNVLVLIGDDHAAYVSGAYGNEKARTPNLDGLAESGFRFNHAYVNCPMCTPSRQSFLTGRLPHSIGVTLLRTALPEEPITLADLFKKQGYDTAAIGKMHFNSDLDHGFDLRLDHREHREHLRKNPPRKVPDEIEVLPDWRPFRDHARIWLNGSYLPYGAYDQDMAGTWFLERGIDFIKKDRENPFLLFLSFYEPHSPFHFPIEFRDLFDPATFEVPEPGPEDDWQVPAIFRDLTESEKQNIIASYYTSVAYLDRNLGRALDALEENGLAENTLVLYFGDHGYNLGHHGRFEKHCFYEQAVKAPLLVRVPWFNRKGKEIEALVEFIDIFPTVADLCGVPIPKEVEGRSLTPLLEGEAGQHRRKVFSEYLWNEEAMVRTQKHKYIYMRGQVDREDGYQTGFPPPGRTRILFDLEKDPGEFKNVAEDPDYAGIVAELEAEMLNRFKETYPQELGLPPPELGGADLLDWYLQPRDVVRD